MSALRDLLNHYRSAAATEREKGTYFENLMIAFFCNDPTYKPQFTAVQPYSDWAKAHDVPGGGGDRGVDLVAINSDDGSFCAIQCKLYTEDRKVQKSDLDKFISASSSAHFTRRLFVDTTRSEWGKNALITLAEQAVPTNRLDLYALEQSPIDWSVYRQSGTVEIQQRKTPRPHQIKAIDDVLEGFKTQDRGKLIMACGTGKTFTSLKIAEACAGAGKRVLYLVPSLALMSQTITEWSIDSDVPLLAFAACSDTQVGKRKASDDLASVNIHDLSYPATTNADKLAAKLQAGQCSDKMTVVFSTYQSIGVISDAQLRYGMDEFDLVICDEAHRTTGVTLANEDDSNFVKIHDQSHVRAARRLYMTATPRIFGDSARTRADEASAELASMDDVSKYGETFHTISFSEAVEQELLTDYKVVVLAVDEGVVSANVQSRLSDDENQLKLDDATKFIGCFRALNKQGIKDELTADPNPMRRAVAFCQNIQKSKLIRDEFRDVVEEYLSEQQEDSSELLSIETEHVDGTYGAKDRKDLLDWLSADTQDDKVCRILSNARCLSEGVDVPSLDAVLFLHPRKSIIDVVQSVGRVMRRSEGKKLGYVILPVGIPAGVEPEEALKDNQRYQVVWEVLNALRSHDDRFDGTINKAGLGVNVDGKIQITALVNDLPSKAPAKSAQSDIGSDKGNYENNVDNPYEGTVVSELASRQTELFIDEFSRAVMAKIVKKCGTRDYWTDWAADIARIAQRHINRITGLVEKEGTKERETFQSFLDEIRDDLNDSITDEDAIEMLAQHVITRPVFDALFEDYSFTKNNPVSKALQRVMDVLDDHNLDKESESLQKFYDSVRRRVEGIGANASAKQRIVVELYDKFFRTAFPRTTQKLGIVYTPVEVVDFIIHSVNDILKQEFNQTLGSEGVSIIDPFTGTGTFITRLMQSGLIEKSELQHKYRHEIWANEIVLLAYYIAAINIEQTYHALMQDSEAGNDYEAFGGICLADTFQLHEKDDMVSGMLEDNSDRRIRQKKEKIKVIIGNPPYSAGQGSANDNNANVAYTHLDEAIRNSYVAHTKVTNVNALYDSYIRAIRWGSDRLEESGSGVMAFVSNAGWIDGNAMDGLRKCLIDEFSSIYVFHLRGNARTQGEQRRKEKGNVFGEGSRTPITISLLVKNPHASEHGKIYFRDIGDYLSREQKLEKIKTFKSIKGISAENGWLPITPDKHNDWLNQRDDSFTAFMSLGDKKEVLSQSLS